MCKRTQNTRDAKINQQHLRADDEIKKSDQSGKKL